MLNRVILIGRLTHDPELHSTGSGVKLVRFKVAVNRRFSNAQGEKEADFIPVVGWRNLAETCANYVRPLRSFLIFSHIAYA